MTPRTDTRLISTYILTDETSLIASAPEQVTVIRRNLKFSGKLAKLEFLASLLDHLETVLFLDVDTEILNNVLLGFDKTEQYGIAMAAAPHHSLEGFRNFGVVMDRESVPHLGQMLYNSGVFFGKSGETTSYVPLEDFQRSADYFDFKQLCNTALKRHRGLW